MDITKVKFRRVIVVLLGLFSCGNGPNSVVQDASIYDDMFAAIVGQDYFDKCWQEELTMLRNKYSKDDSVDEALFRSKYDSLKTRAGTSAPKCIIFQKRTFEGIIAQYFNFDELSQNSFVHGKFEKYSEAEIVKHLSTPRSISPTFDGKFLDLRQSESNDTAYENGTIGSFAFSECIISDLADRAILYYEFDCGINCGQGVLLLAEKKNTQWLIKKMIPIWDR